MENLNKLYQELEAYKDFDSDPNNIEKFLDTVDEIVLLKNSSSIPILLQYFDDESDYSWVFEELIGYVESYESEEYVTQFLKNFNILENKAKEYLSSLIFHIFNSSQHFSLFRKHMHLADRQALLKLFDIMEEESPHHAELIQELRKELV